VLAADSLGKFAKAAHSAIATLEKGWQDEDEDIREAPVNALKAIRASRAAAGD
jgi:hypothetical protein